MQAVSLCVLRRQPLSAQPGDYFASEPLMRLTFDLELAVDRRCGCVLSSHKAIWQTFDGQRILVFARGYWPLPPLPYRRLLSRRLTCAI